MWQKLVWSGSSLQGEVWGCPYLVLFYLGEDSVKDEAWRRSNVQALLRKSQPIDEVLQGILEFGCQVEHLFQLGLNRGQGRGVRQKKRGT